MNRSWSNSPLTQPMASDLPAVRRRTRLVGFALMMALGGLGYRAYLVSITAHAHYQERGNHQQLRTYRLDASRGDVVDRSHVALAVNDRVFRIVLNPRLIRSQGVVDSVVSAITELFPADTAHVREELGHDKAYRRLDMQLDDLQAATLRARQLPGVRLEQSPHRVYPRKHLAAHLLGRVNGQGKGHLGIEYGMEEELRGRNATSPAYIARGKKILVDGHPDPGVSRGHTVVLTIDSAIQAMAEEAIDGLVETWHPVGASVLVLDPNSGEVLAMANRPTFDPNHRVASVQQTFNLAVQAAYEPGSTMKAITVAAALEQGTIRRDQTFFCEEGRWQYTPEHAIKDTKPSEWLNVTQILAVSSNICTTKIYETLGKEALFNWVKRFHFGERPPIQLPGATTGLLATWNKWSDIQAANISFGQGMSASPLQVAAAFSAIANDGVYHPPVIVRSVIANDGTVVWEPEHEPERLIRSSTARTLMTMLESVAHDKLGTGKNARIEGYRVAGKTSTAQKASGSGGYAEDQHYASFVGAVPADDARIVILVSVDNPEGRHYGNDVAAPTFSTLGGRIMSYLGVPRLDGTRPTPEVIDIDAPQLSHGFVATDDVEPALPGQRKIPYATTGLPDFTGLGLAQVVDAAKAAGVRLRVVGSGVAVMQDTPPGPIAAGTTVHVFFEPPA